MNVLKSLYFILTILLVASCTTEPTTFLSPNSLLINQNENKLIVADETANRISVIDLETKKVTDQIELEGKPSGLTLSKDRSKLYATIALPQGKLIEIDLSTNQIGRSLNVGHSPIAPVLSADEKTLYLCNQFNNSIISIDVKSFNVLNQANADREPIAIGLASKSNKLLVANHIPSGSASDVYHSSKVAIYNAKSLKLQNEILLPNGSNALNKISISPDEKFAYITHILARYNVPTTHVERGWINTNAMSIVDISSNKLLCTVLLDDLDRGAANPFDVKCSTDGNQLFVTHRGTDEFSIIDRIDLHERINQTVNQTNLSWYAKSLQTIQDDLSFLQDIRIRVKLEGKGPKSIAVDDDKLYISMYYSGTIQEYELKSSQLANISLGKQPVNTAERNGEIYFHDATHCKQNWQSCSSCHPGDARVDGLNWDNLNDGIGNPKNTRSMLNAHATPPSMITGIRPDAQTAVRAGIKHILSTSLPEEKAQDIDAYLISLKAVTSPYLEDGKLSEAASLGKEVFKTAGCIDCHAGPYFTKQEKNDVGTGIGLEEGRKFDTPSLIEIWRTAPYLYNGRAQTVKEVLTTHNTKGKHGDASELSETDIDYLVEYVLSL